MSKPRDQRPRRSYSRYEKNNPDLASELEDLANQDVYAPGPDDLISTNTLFEGTVPPGEKPPADPPIDSPFSVLSEENISTSTGDELDVFDGKLTSKSSGFNNSHMEEKQPNYNKTDSEEVIKGKNNTYIILGRDRIGKVNSGYGGKGHTRSGAIDIVVGLQGFDPGRGDKSRTLDSLGRPTGDPSSWHGGGLADKNFGSLNQDISPGDAARIYISQRADIDDYFDICDGFVGRSFSDSAIAMKADSVRIIARKGIKLVTQKNPPGRNALDGKIMVTYGIDLIAGNRDIKTGLEGLVPANPEFGTKREINYLQPIPKGDNLQEYLLKIHGNIQLVNSILAGLLLITPKLIRATLSPKAVVGVGGGTAFPGLSDLTDVFSYMVLLQKQFGKLAASRIGMLAYEVDYLHSVGAIYINSRHNRTN